jgi:hypothetical protein
MDKKATKAQTVERLKVLRQIELANPCSYGFRFYLDRIIGGHLFYEGALPTNWRSTPKKLRKLIQQSVGVQALATSGRTDRDLGKLIMLEHAYTMCELMRLVLDEKYAQAIGSYDVRFITREEDTLLKIAERKGYSHAARYEQAGLKFE